MKGSAFGKVILLGEHAVVYGVPAIVVGIDRGAEANVTAIDGSRKDSELVLRVESRDESHAPLSVRATEQGDVARAFASLLDAAEVNVALRVEVSTHLPAGAGLGCSAALGVAIARAIGATIGPSSTSENRAVQWATAWERVFHGNPSGVDAAAASRGGCLLYRREEGRPVVIEPLVLGSTLSLAIGHTGSACSTRTMVEQVARLRDRQPALVADAFARILALVPAARRALEKGDLAALGRSMNENQTVLDTLSVSTAEIDGLCASARAEGALGAKLTGSGGGGCVVALTDGDPDRIVRVWQERGYHAFSTLVRQRVPSDCGRTMVEA